MPGGVAGAQPIMAAPYADGVALGITAYGVLAAMGVRAAVWSARR